MAERILVIDDEPDMLVLLKMIIEGDTDYTVKTTNTPSEGLKLLTEENYDLLITDLKMPGMDGLEVFDELTALKPDIPVIIITAYGSPEAADEAIKKGVSDFITKPFRKDTIIFTVKRVLELSRLRKENLALKRKLEEIGG